MPRPKKIVTAVVEEEKSLDIIEIPDILEDDELIHVLDESKATSDDIKIRLAESEIAEKEIDRTREVFRPVAFRASILFFTIIDLSAINEMY
jgi:dynein heavy chain